MTKNRLFLSGTICFLPVCKVSPSGIQHYQFLLEHHSQKMEAGLIRQAWCRMHVVISGKSPHTLTEKLIVGSQISVQGFISCHKGKNGMNKLVLHAEQIQLIDCGD